MIHSNPHERQNMKTIIDILMHEHEIILKGLHLLEQMNNHSMTNPHSLQTGLSFIKTFVDEIHHFKEEELLFKALENIGFPKDQGPIGMMLYEHNEGRQIVQALQKYVDLQSFSQQNQLESQNHFQAFISLLREHIEKENNILYPMALSQLSEASLKELFDQCMAFETKNAHKRTQTLDAFFNLVEPEKVPSASLHSAKSSSRD